MATPARSSGLFSGSVLIFFGVLLLLHNYGHLEIAGFVRHWWPLMIIFWGAVKLYERTVGRRFGGGDGGRATGSEASLVLGMVALVAIVGLATRVKDHFGPVIDPGESFSYDIDVAPKKVPANARVMVRNGRGDIIVRGSDNGEIRVTATKTVKSWSETEAARVAEPVKVTIEQNGDGYEVHPAGFDLSSSKIGVNLEVAIPKKSVVSVKTEKGDVTVSGIFGDVVVTDMTGDVDVRGTAGDVNVEMRKGDAKVSGTRGDVKISGKGGEIEVNDMEREIRKLTRREMVEKLLAGMAAGVSWPLIASSHPIHQHLKNGAILDRSEAAQNAADWKPLFLNPQQNETLVALSESIVPGSAKAHVNRFIDLLLSVDSTESQEKFAASLAAIDGEARKRFAPRCSPILRIDDPTDRNAALGPF